MFSLDRRAVVVDRQQVPVAILGVEMRVRDVPLALVERPIAAGPEPVAQRRHRVRRQPEHVVAVGALGDPVGLRHAVQRRVLAGQQRRAARRARRRHRIVMAERHAVLPQPLHARQMLSPVLGELVGLVRRRVVLLIGHDDQDVRATRHAATLTLALASGASSRSGDALHTARSRLCLDVRGEPDRHAERGRSSAPNALPGRRTYQYTRQATTPCPNPVPVERGRGRRVLDMIAGRRPHHRHARQPQDPNTAAVTLTAPPSERVCNPTAAAPTRGMPAALEDCRPHQPHPRGSGPWLRTFSRRTAELQRPASAGRVPEVQTA